MRAAIVTGASSGIGAEFCRALDGEGLDMIWLVASRPAGLEAVASGLGTPARILAADLATAEGVDLLVSDVSSRSPEIAFLVNCAGFGRFGTTSETAPEDIRNMVSLNCTALAEITSRCIPFMTRGSWIVQVCSASAYLPLEGLNVYASSKAFVRAFCDGLRPELEASGIGVLEVSPGWVDTPFIGRAVAESDIPEGVFRHTVTAEDVVNSAMADLRRGRNRSYCGAYNRLQVAVCKHLPSIAALVWKRSLRG